MGALLISWTFQVADPLRVFIRGGIKTHGPNQHDHPRFLGEWTKLLGDRGIQVDGAMDFPNAAQLERTDVLIIYAADGMKITGENRAAFEKYLQRGGGVMVLHDGVVGGDQHEWVKKVIGGAWRWTDATIAKEKATKWLEGDVGCSGSTPTIRSVAGVEFSIGRTRFTTTWIWRRTSGRWRPVFTTSTSSPRRSGPTRRRGTEAGRRTAPSSPSPATSSTCSTRPSNLTPSLRGIAWTGKRSNVDDYCKPEELASLKYPPGGPRSAADEAKTMQLHPEFNLSLAADENIAEKIMSLDWIPRGRLWVVETPEYPNGRDINKSDARITPWRAREPEKFPVGAKGTPPGP